MPALLFKFTRLVLALIIAIVLLGATSLLLQAGVSQAADTDHAAATAPA